MKAGRPFAGVVLIGFMGSGKSSVGRELARRARAEFVDLDSWIERSAGRTVRELFATEGELAFRGRERAALTEVLAVRGRVVATGGGAFLEEGNRSRLQAYGPVVFLEATPETILQRLSGDTGRPLLGTGDREGTVRELLARRTSLYRLADHTVATDGRTVAQVAGRILELLGVQEGRDA